jgi:Fungal protein kinase
MVVDGQEFLVDVTHPLHKAFVIRGCGSCTMPCRRGTEEFVIKLSWPEQTRQTEIDILRVIKERAGNCPEIMNHISEVIASEIFDETSTDKIREALGLASHPRRLAVTVLRRCAGKNSQLSG